MKCPNCGAPSDGKSRFCEYCGSELPQPPPQPAEPEKSGNVTQNVTNVYYVNQVQPAQPVYVPSYAVPQPRVSAKNRNLAMVLCLFFGLFGVHLFYVGRWKKGVLYLFTLGLVGLGWLWDLVMIGSNRFKDSYGLPLVGKSVWGKRIFYFLLVLYGFSLLSSSESSEMSFGSVLIIGVFGWLLLSSFFRKKKK